MNRETRAERRSKARRRAQAFAGTSVLVVIAVVAGLWTQKGEPLDDQGCPKETDRAGR